MSGVGETGVWVCMQSVFLLSVLYSIKTNEQSVYNVVSVHVYIVLCGVYLYIFMNNTNINKHLTLTPISRLTKYHSCFGCVMV